MQITPTEVIRSTSNPRVKALIKARRRRVRDSSKITVVEGYDEIHTAVIAGVRPLELYYCPAIVADNVTTRLRRLVGNDEVRVVQLAKPVFEKVAYRESPDGWLAVLPTVSGRLDDLTLSSNPLILVAESVEKPGNLGAILRTADAAGIDAVISADAGTDWGNPNLIRASKGTAFTVPVAEAATPDVLAWLKKRNIVIVATTPGSGPAFTDIDYTVSVAIAVGSESQGLSQAWLDQADVLVEIPMFGRVNSLNVSTSAAIVMYEALRQRDRPIRSRSS